MSLLSPPAAAPTSRPLRALDRFWRVGWDQPIAFFLVPLGIGLALAVADRESSTALRIECTLTAAVQAVWLWAWHRFRPAEVDAPARWPFLGLVAVGAAIMIRLNWLHPGFIVAFIAILPFLAISTPLWFMIPLAFAMMVPVDLSFRRMILHGTAMTSGVPFILILRMMVAIVVISALRTMALQGAERKRLLETLSRVERRAGMLEERQRIAREIHDTLAQGFAGILLHLDAAESATQTIDGMRPHLRHARDVARENLEEARRMMAAMRPELLEQHALEAALRRSAGEWTQRTGTHTTVLSTGESTPLHADVEVTLLRAAQEALTNVARHAGATSVSITVSYMPDVVLLDVHDDGVGFVPDAVTTGLGLRGMRERVEQIGGAIAVESAPGDGTTISVSLPTISAADWDAPTGERS